MQNRELNGLVTGLGRKTIVGLLDAQPSLEEKGLKFRVVWMPSTGANGRRLSYFMYKLKSLLLLRKDSNVIFWSIFSRRLDFIMIQCASSVYRFTFTYIILYFIAKARGTKFFLVYRNCGYNISSTHQKFQGTLLGRLKSRLGRRLVRSSKVINAALSPECAADVRKHFNIQDVAVLGSAPLVPQEELIHEVPVDPPMYLNIGNFSYRKGCDLFIDVALRCLEKNNHIKFCWIGKNTPNPEDIAEICEKGYLHNFEFTSTKHIPFDYIRRSSGLIFTSRSDCYPKVVSEAYAMRRSVFCFEGTGGAHQAGDVGYIYKRFDVQAMADDVLEHAQRARGERINNLAFERYEAELSSSVLARKFEDFIRARVV